MAYHDPSLPDPETNVLPTGFYNVNRAVGKGSANRKGDVMLVQLLLKKFYAKKKDVPPPPGQMKVDGLFGPTTATWIARFQLQQNPLFPNGVATDGVVDRAKDPWVSTISHTLYTILVLNFWLRQTDVLLFENLAFDPECPALLKNELVFNTGVE
jgi:hypothetical protein